MRASVAESARLLGGLDAVVAAAGVVPAWQHPGEMDLDDFDRVLAINARGVANTVKHTSGVLGAGSTITVVASLNSWRGDPNILSYAASKHAALGIVRSAALALGPGGIRVNAVAPGPIATEALRTRMASRLDVTGLPVDNALEQAARATSLGRIATAAEVADTIAFLTSDLSSGITGQLINVDGGIH
jgi:3alpha(or 20beta)-hydroxysteroid dehydrogenase